MERNVISIRQHSRDFLQGPVPPQKLFIIFSFSASLAPQSKKKKTKSTSILKPSLMWLCRNVPLFYQEHWSDLKVNIPPIPNHREMNIYIEGCTIRKLRQKIKPRWHPSLKKEKKKKWYYQISNQTSTHHSSYSLIQDHQRTTPDQMDIVNFLKKRYTITMVWHQCVKRVQCISEIRYSILGNSSPQWGTDKVDVFVKQHPI